MTALRSFHPHSYFFHKGRLGLAVLAAGVCFFGGHVAWGAPAAAAPAAKLAPGLIADDETATLAAWQARIHAGPARDATVALWPQFVEMAQFEGRWDLLMSAARDILAAHDAPPALTASAQQTLAFAADRSGDAKTADGAWQALGYVRQWQVIGPFDNASQSGFDHAYPPEQGIALSAVCAGRDDQQLHWHRLALLGRDGQCAVGRSLSDGAANVFYAATSLLSPRAQEARLQFDPTGASKVFVNGALVFTDSLVRSHQDLVADPFSIPVTLRQGPNVVLVKTADDDQTTAAFALRVTAADGTVLTGVTADAHNTPIALATALMRTGAAMPHPALPARVETVWTAAARRLPAGPASAALVGDLLRRAQDDATSAETLRAALQDAPQDGWLHWQLSQTLTDDDQTDEAHAERDLALAAIPDLVDAQVDALSDGDIPAADKIARLKAVCAHSPHSPDAAWALANAYKKANLSALALATGRKALALSGGDETVTEMASLYEDLDCSIDAAHLLKTVLKTTPGASTVLQKSVDMVSEDADPAPVIARIQVLLALDPTLTSYRTTLAQNYEDRHDNAAALRTLQRLRLERPQSGVLCAQMADLLQEQGHRQAATALYQEAIRLAPANLALREKLAVLSGEKPALDLAPAVPAEPILTSARQAQATDGASALFLLDEQRTVVYPDFATLSRVHQIVKVFDEAGVKRYQTYSLSVPEASATATVESARVLKADGKVQDVTDGDGNDDNSVAFPSLSPGDVIDVTYRVENCRHGALARQFWAQWEFDVADAPSRLSRFVLIAPPGIAFQTAGHGAVPAVSTKDVGAWRIQEWRLADIPARSQEAGMVGYVDSARWLDISTVKSWQQIVDWYRGLSEPRCVPDTAVRAKALALTADCHTDTEKLQALEQFVAQEVQYQSSPFRLSAYVPTEGKQVLRERYGDCKDKAALLTAMLAAVGIHSDMVLLSPRSHGLTPYLPSPRFNHAIARVQTAQGPLWVDATADQLRFGGLPNGDQQVPSLVIAPATTGLTDTPLLPLSSAEMEDASVCTLDAQGGLHMQSTWTMQDHMAWIMRSAWREIPASKQDQALRYVAGEFFKGGTYDSGSLEQLAAIDKPLVMHLAYHADRYSTSAGSFRLLPLPWSEEGPDDTLTRLQTTAPRTQDLETADSRGRFHSTLDLTLPAGWTPQEMPADSHSETPFGSYHVTYTLHGAVLHGEREMDLTALRVPAAQVPQYVTFLEAVAQEDQKQLVLHKL